jgi:aminoacyl tRNA synthase complex-interacting multifunctional protein 1
MTTTPKSAKELLETAIRDLECRLGMKPGEETGGSGGNKGNDSNKKSNNKKANNGNNKPKQQQKAAAPAPSADDDGDVPDILKLEFKVGQITKVWNHPEADKLYCEEIDVGEETPRQIASGLRPHFSLEQMQGQRLLVVSNLKPKNLVKFKSHGMVLCAATAQDDGTERVEFVEPPADAPIGEVVSFVGLPSPRPLAPSQVEKKKVFLNCMDGMKCSEEGLAVWNGHIFTTSAGHCTVKRIRGGVLR